MKIKTATYLFLFLLTLGLSAQAKPMPVEAEEEAMAGRQLTYGDAFVLGLVQGITEYLPISSTGHLILTNHFLDLDKDIPLFDEKGDMIYHENDYTGENEPYTLKKAINNYSIIIQGGSIFAVALLYWDRILQIIFGLLGKNPKGFLLFRNLMVALIPAAILGTLFHDVVDIYLYNPITVIIALVLGAFLMLWVEAWRKKQPFLSTEMELGQMSITQSLFVGFMQVFAMCPGVSRSMMTLVGCYLVGLKPVRAAEFSFLLGLITLSGATGLKFISHGNEIMHGLSFGPLFFGCIIAFIASALAIKWLIGYLTRHGLGVFAWYRLGLAAFVFFLLYVFN